MREKRIFLVVTIAAILLVAALQTNVFSQDEGVEDRLHEIERSMIIEGNYEEVTEKLFKILEYYPGNARAYLDLGMAHYGLMKYNKAYEYLKKSEAMGPKGEIEAVLNYALSKMEQNRTTLKGIEETNDSLKVVGTAEKEALKEEIASRHAALLGELLEKRYYPVMVTAHAAWLKDNEVYFPQAYRVSGDIYYTAMFYKEATEDYKKAIEKDPDDGELHRILADCLVAMGDFDQAQEYYDKAIALYIKAGFPKKDPKVLQLEKVKRALPKKYKDVADLVKNNRYEAAEAICRKRMSLNPGDYVAITQLGDIYWQKDNRKMAEKLFRKVVRRAPDYPIAHFLLGRAYFFRRKHKAAVAEFETFKEKMELLPKTDEETIDFYVSALHNIGYMYSTLKRYDMMLRECKKALELKPEDQITHYNLAVCYYNYDRKLSLAYRELQKVIAIDDSTELAERANVFIDYMRRNPDPRFIPDFSFILED